MDKRIKVFFFLIKNIDDIASVSDMNDCFSISVNLLRLAILVSLTKGLSGDVSELAGNT